MKNNPLLIITDADAMIALVSVQDTNHARAAQIARYCSDNQAALLFPITALCEATTILRKRLNNPEGAHRLIENTRSGTFPNTSNRPGCVHDSTFCLSAVWLKTEHIV